MKKVFDRLWHSPTFTTWGSLSMRLASALIILPIVLVRFPSAEVVVWQLFSSFFVLALLLDIGLSATFSRMIAFARGGASVSEMKDMRSTKERAQGDRTDETLSIVETLRWITPRMALVTFTLLAVFGTAALQKPMAGVSNVGLGWFAWFVVLCSSGISFWGIAYTATLQGMNSIAPLRRLEVAIGLLQILSSILTLLFGGELFLLVLVFQFWTVIGVLATRWLLRKRHPELLATAALLHREIFKVMWPASWRAGLGHLMGGGIVQLSGVIYSQFGNPQEVAAYLVALRAVTVISGFSQAPFYSKLPRLAELQASGSRSEQRVLAQRGMRVAHWVFVLGAVTAGFMVGPVLAAIGSKTPFVSGGVWTLMVFAFFMERFGAMHLQWYSLTNHIVWHIANGVTGVIMILIAVFSYPWVGQYSFPLAMLIAYTVFYSVYTVRLSYRCFGLSLYSFESKAMLPAIVALFAGSIGALLMHRH